MKNKIIKFSKGDFQSLKTDIVFEETNLVLPISEGEVHKSSLTLKTESNRMIRGLLYTSSDHIKFKNQGFEGNPAVIEFVYDGRGLVPGHVEKGKITVVSDAGEYEVSFTALIEKPYVMTNYGKVQSTEDFRKLAVKDYEEAVKLFRSRSFYDILKYENDRIFYLYDNMRKWELSEQAMEEFLVGIKQKECLFLTISGEESLFEDLKEEHRGTIHLVKNTWGFMNISVKIDGDFIEIEKPVFTTHDFVGNAYDLSFVIHPEKLHGGQNFGAISFVTPYETLNYKIEVIQNCSVNEDRKEIRRTKVRLFKDYIDYTAGKMDSSVWIANAVENMNLLCRMDPKNDYYQLVRANILLIGQKKEEARQVLDNFNFGRFTGIRNPIHNAYYSFLNAWLKGSTSYMERALDDIYKALSTHPDSWILLSMALTMDARLKSPYRKIELLEEYFEYGTNEVLFYLEVYKCYKEKPTLLRQFGKLEKEVLNFASKYGLISKEMSFQIAAMSSHQKNFDHIVYQILIRLYEQYEENTILNALCTFMIKGNKIGPKYFAWYKKAVSEELKIAQLFEYYMYSIEEHMFKEPLPDRLLQYFAHGNSLDYKKKAVLYANVLLHEKQLADLYKEHEKQIIDFTWEQVGKRHISEPLRILYKRFCLGGELNPERIEAIRDICYSYLIKTHAENMNLVLVIENNGEIGQKVRYDAKNGAIIRLYNNDSRIVWQSVDGHYYTDSIVYETKRLFYEPEILELCNNYEMSLMASEDEEKKVPSIEGIREYGLKAFRLEEVLEFCKAQIIEKEYKEDSFLLSLAYALFDQDMYDHETLAYLAEYYCGPTVSMKRIWKVLDEMSLPKLKLSESIITQAIFTEHVFNDERIFEDYCQSDSVYTSLKLAYLAYVSREYILCEKEIDPLIFGLIIREAGSEVALPDVCKIAALKHYSSNEASDDKKEILHSMMRELCEKNCVFPFFMEYDQEWLQELMIYDKSMILYKAQQGSRVTLFYKVDREDGESSGYCSETMIPVFENLFLKQFILFDDETLKYYVQEFSKKGTMTSEKKILTSPAGSNGVGKYGKINGLLSKAEEEKEESMQELATEMILAEQIFKID